MLGYRGVSHPSTGVPFDSRGFPVFDRHIVYETRISEDAVRTGKGYIHMREATNSLRASLRRGEIQYNRFNNQQLEAILAGERKIPGLTWHHHQESGRMQLLPETVHRETAHIGGDKLW